MQTRYILPAFIILMTLASGAQSFQEIPISLPNVNHGGSCWGDFDNDGDLDLVLNGQQSDWTGATFILENIDGQFTEVTHSIPSLFSGSARWGDFDNDDDLDLLLCGMNDMGEGATYLFRNDNGTFIEVATPFTGIADGHVLWLDENRDNWLDVLVTGDTMYNTPVTNLYRNNGDGTFSYVDTKLPASMSSSYTAGDYDNDGDDDIFITGFYENTYASRLFRNDNAGSFTDTQIIFDSVAYGDMIFLDVDKDLDLDIVYMGSDLYSEYITNVYRNDGNEIFTKIPQSIEGEWIGQIDAGDFDNDGDPDLAITGALCCGDALTELYKNDGSGNFSLFETDLPPRTFSQIRFGDYDNDGDADILLTGLAEMTTGLPVTQIFRNSWGSNTFGPNDPPAEPENLSVEIDLNDVTFSWSPADDDHTPSAALTYNLYLGNHAPAFFDVFAPLANAATGFVKAYAIGNTNQNAGWIIKDLPAGTYYWSVQALDHSLCGSEFAPEQTFEITYVGLEGTILTPGFTVYPNPTTDFINLKSETEGELIISDIRGSILGVYNVLEGVTTIPATNLARGIYIIRFSTGNKVTRTKLIKD